MNEFLKKLFENQVLDAETKKVMADTWEKALKEAEKIAAANARHELGERYKEDRARLIASIDQMMQEAINAEFVGVKQDLQEVSRLKRVYAKKITLAEATQAKKLKRVARLVDKFVSKKLESEIKEFRQDRAEQRAETTRAIVETRANAERERAKFIERGARVLENLADKRIGKFISEMAEDIEAARQSDIGRRLFDAMIAEMQSVHFDASEHTKKLAESEKKARAENAALRKMLKEQNQKYVAKIKASEKEKQKLAESAKRKAKIDMLCGKLNGPARDQMRVILEATETSRLDTTFDQFAKSAIDQNAPGRQRQTFERPTLREHSVRTGRTSVEVQPSAEDEEIKRLQHRAGIRK